MFIGLYYGNLISSSSPLLILMGEENFDYDHDEPLTVHNSAMSILIPLIAYGGRTDL